MARVVVGSRTAPTGARHGRATVIGPGLTRAVSCRAGARASVLLGAVPVLDGRWVRGRGRGWFLGET